ncbi:HFX_2341 family transcriptional regulator domain-containing protein [Natrinema gari]
MISDDLLSRDNLEDDEWAQTPHPGHLVPDSIDRDRELEAELENQQNIADAAQQMAAALQNGADAGDAVPEEFAAQIEAKNERIRDLEDRLESVTDERDQLRDREHLTAAGDLLDEFDERGTTIGTTEIDGSHASNSPWPPSLTPSPSVSE